MNPNEYDVKDQEPDYQMFDYLLKIRGKIIWNIKFYAPVTSFKSNVCDRICIRKYQWL